MLSEERSGEPEPGSPPSLLLAVDEFQQILVDHIRMGDRHPMGISRIDLQGGVLDDFRRQRTCIRERHNLVIISMHHERWTLDFLEILREVSLGECLDAVV